MIATPLFEKKRLDIDKKRDTNRAEEPGFIGAVLRFEQGPYHFFSRKLSFTNSVSDRTIRK